MADNRLEWSNELRAEKGENPRYRSSLRAHLALPKVEKKIKLVIVQENREEAVAPIPSEPGTPVVNTPTQANSFRCNATAGFRAPVPPRLYLPVDKFGDGVRE